MLVPHRCMVDKIFARSDKISIDAPLRRACLEYRSAKRLSPAEMSA